MSNTNRTQLPVSQLWDQTRAFVQRESSLLLPTTMATIAMGQAGMDLGSQLSQTGWGGVSLLLILFSVLLLLVGQMAIMALALKPGLSVGEALRVGLNRLPRVIGFGLLVAVGVIIVMLPLAIYLAATGVKVGGIEGGLPPGASLYVLILAGVLIWVSVRYYTLVAQIVDQDAPLGVAMGESFKATKGNALQILGVLLLFLLVSLVVQAAVQLVLGLLFGALGKMLEMALLPELFVALGSGMALAVIGLYSTVFTAFAWRHLSA